MSVAVITGSAGLIGSESARYFSALGMDIVGIDNDMRKVFFGDEASTLWNRQELESTLKRYKHADIDIRDRDALDKLFKTCGADISLVVHCAAQPSHDWAARDPITDFAVNATGTLNMLEVTRHYCEKAVFIFTSTNKVYGDAPNELPLVELETRWEIDPSHAYSNGIPETMSIDQSKHSLFGAAKLSADILVQEYGRYFGMRTVCFRGGCLTGPRHSGTQLHGFLSYLMKCAATGTAYSVLGYKGKQVRDNIHSADLVAAFHEFFTDPDAGAVYNMGGGRESNCSMKEAIAMCEEIAGRKMNCTYMDANRIGDHIWYISNLAKFKARYPKWKIKHTVPDILREIYDANKKRWAK